MSGPPDVPLTIKQCAALLDIPAERLRRQVRDGWFKTKVEKGVKLVSPAEVARVYETRGLTPRGFRGPKPEERHKWQRKSKSGHGRFGYLPPPLPKTEE